MRENHLLELFYRHLVFDGDACALNDFRARIADKVHTDHFPGLLLSYYFAEAILPFIFSHKPSGITHRQFLYYESAFGGCLFFGDADTCNLRICLDDSRDSPVAHPVIFPQNVVYCNFSFPGSGMRQH